MLWGINWISVVSVVGGLEAERTTSTLGNLGVGFVDVLLLYVRVDPR